MEEPSSPDEVMAWRKRARALLLDARMAVPVEDHQLISDGAFRWVEDIFLQSLKTCTVALYWPFKRELNCLRFADRLLAAGGRVAMPVVVEKDAPLRFRAWKPGDEMAQGVWDIPYPARGAYIEPEALIVPLLGFDAAGYRLGYGGGYYDRTLERFAKPLTIGVGYEDSRLDTIHPLDHDVPMDFIVTEDGVFQRSSEDAH
jgi:5-formyltetrahydrofolate cyclo-ligase